MKLLYIIVNIIYLQFKNADVFFVCFNTSFNDLFHHFYYY